MESATIALLMSGATLVLSVGIIVFNGGWGLSRKLGGMESRLTQTIAETTRELEDKQESMGKMVGDTIAAIREQINLNEKAITGDLHTLSERMSGVEKWARDEFVRKESFREVANRIEATVAAQGRDINGSMQSVRDAILMIATGRKIEGAG